MHKPIVGPGLCECGCGQATAICTSTSAKRNVRKGEHCRYVSGHCSRSGPVAFWGKVPDHLPSTDCWPWQGSRRAKGYGLFGGTNATHIVYRSLVGPIPEGLQVLHTCDNPPCVNPAHLFLGTNDDNVADKVAKGRGQLYTLRKLTNAQVAEIERRRASGGVTQRQLARDYGVTQAVIQGILAGKSYRVRKEA